MSGQALQLTGRPGNAANDVPGWYHNTTGFRFGEDRSVSHSPTQILDDLPDADDQPNADDQFTKFLNVMAPQNGLLSTSNEELQKQLQKCKKDLRKTENLLQANVRCLKKAQKRTDLNSIWSELHAKLLLLHEYLGIPPKIDSHDTCSRTACNPCFDILNRSFQLDKDIGHTEWVKIQTEGYFQLPGIRLNVRRELIVEIFECLWKFQRIGHSMGSISYDFNYHETEIDMRARVFTGYHQIVCCLPAVKLGYGRDAEILVKAKGYYDD